jgi:hypothetical protein
VSWLVPSALAIAGGAAIVVAALHFIARSRPLAEPLPTVRFVPERPVYARARSIALTDILLMLVRIAAVLAIGLAIAGPMFGGRSRIARIVLVDQSRAVGSAAELRDSVRAVVQSADVVVPFDSTARTTNAAAVLDSIAPSAVRGSLSAGIAAAIRAGVTASAKADSVELVVVSPLSVEEIDAATTALRNAWPGRLRLVRVRAAAADSAPRRVETLAAPQDAVVAGLGLAGLVAPSATIRLVRNRPTAADSLWARTAGHLLIHWPAADTNANWPARPSIDAIGGVATRTAALVARFPRLWLLSGSDVVARWSDGEPAAVDHRVGDGCIRDVGILIDEMGDLTLRPVFRRFVSGLLAPCGGERRMTPANAAFVSSLAGNGPLAAANALRDRGNESSPWTLWLLLLGALLLLVELALRRSMGRAA